MHEHNIMYVFIKEIHHQSHHEYETSADQQGMTHRISQIKHIDHTVYANHKDCNFENKISIPSGRVGSTRKVTWCFVDVVVPLDTMQKCCSEDHARSPSANATPGRRQICRREQKGVVPRRRRGPAASNRAAADTPQKRDCRPHPSR